MSILTTWSEGRQPTAGLDQLGVRGNSVRMYGYLIPGITNVTNRVRYYSMHAWFVQWWAKKVATADNKVFDYKAFRKKIRIFECIVGMAERIRGYEKGEDFLAVTGADTFRKWLQEQDGLKASTDVPLKDLANHYWKHSGGGFGQYYRGSAEALGIIREDKDIVGLTPEFGIPLADAFEEMTDGTELEKMVRQETATIGQLRKLVEVSTFQEIRGRESTILRHVLFDEKNVFGSEGQRRRNSLLAILALAQDTPGGIEENPLWQVLDAALHGRTSANTEFNIPKPLIEHFALWRSYSLQEYLASGLEILLSVAVETVGQREFDRGFLSVDEVAEAVAEKVSVKIDQKMWGDLVDESIERWKWPSLNPKSDSFDERDLRDKAVAVVWNDGAQALTTALNLLARVTSRIRDGDPYEGFRRGKMALMSGRISLLDWYRFSNERARMNCREFLSNAVAWSLRTHLRIAGAKLIYTKVYTYKAAFFDGRLIMVDRMEPALNQPRLLQATRMLTDLGLLRWNRDHLTISAEGRHILKEYSC